MRTGLKKRLAVVGVALTPPKKRLIIMRTIAPYNFWDVRGLQVSTSVDGLFIIERDGDRFDVATLHALVDQAKNRATILEPQKGYNCVSMRFIMDEGAKSCTQHNYSGTIPDNLRNTHLITLYQY